MSTEPINPDEPEIDELSPNQDEEIGDSDEKEIDPLMLPEGLLTDISEAYEESIENITEDPLDDEEEVSEPDEVKDL